MADLSKLRMRYERTLNPESCNDILSDYERNLAAVDSISFDCPSG